MNTKTLTLPISEIKSVSVKKIAEKLNITPEQSAEIFEQLIFAEMSGKKSHGLVRIPWLISQKETLQRHEAANRTTNGLITYFDCSASIGYLAANEIVREIKKMPGPVSVAVGRDLFPSGMLGYYVRKLIPGNLVFIFGTTPPLIKLPEKQTKMWGTNPFAGGIDTADAYPLIVDMATSQGSFGEFLEAKYGIKAFEPTKYRTRTNTEPPTVEELLHDGNFDGSLVQKLSAEHDFKQYSLMVLVQLLVSLIAQTETRRGDLVFVTIQKDYFGTNDAPFDSLIKTMRTYVLPQELPGTHSARIFEKNVQRDTLTIPEVLWNEIRS